MVLEPILFVTLVAVLIVSNVAYIQLAHRYFRLLLMQRKKSVPKTAVGVFIESWRTFVRPHFRQKLGTNRSPSQQRS